MTVTIWHNPKCATSRQVLDLLTTDTGLFARLGYGDCGRDAVPAAVASSRLFTQRRPASAAMVKHIG